jgi:hypothetical protein
MPESNKQLDHAYALGISSGLKHASKKLMEEAVGMWKKRRDPEALLVRKLSETLAEMSEEAHPGRLEEK